MIQSCGQEVALVNRLELDTQTDDTGSLQVRLPGRQAAYRVHISIEWEEAPVPAVPGWPPGWFEATAGSVGDPTFVRQPQGTPESRGEL
jgi:hypothetical protein